MYNTYILKGSGDEDTTNQQQSSTESVMDIGTDSDSFDFDQDESDDIESTPESQQKPSNQQKSEEMARRILGAAKGKQGRTISNFLPNLHQRVPQQPAKPPQPSASTTNVVSFQPRNHQMQQQQSSFAAQPVYPYNGSQNTNVVNFQPNGMSRYEYPNLGGNMGAFVMNRVPVLPNFSPNSRAPLFNTIKPQSVPTSAAEYAAMYYTACGAQKNPTAHPSKVINDKLNVPTIAQIYANSHTHPKQAPKDHETYLNMTKELQDSINGPLHLFKQHCFDQDVGIVGNLGAGLDKTQQKEPVQAPNLPTTEDEKKWQLDQEECDHLDAIDLSEFLNSANSKWSLDECDRLIRATQTILTQQSNKGIATSNKVFWKSVATEANTSRSFKALRKKHKEIAKDKDHPCHSVAAKQAYLLGANKTRNSASTS